MILYVCNSGLKGMVSILLSLLRQSEPDFQQDNAFLWASTFDPLAHCPITDLSGIIPNIYILRWLCLVMNRR